MTVSATGTLTTGQRIKMARAEKGLKQSELAALAGVAQADLSRWESGRQQPTAASVDKVFAALGGSIALDAVDGTFGIFGREAGGLIDIDPLGDAPAVEWVVEGFAAKGAVTMIAGAPGAGKSLLTQALAVASSQAMAAQTDCPDCAGTGGIDTEGDCDHSVVFAGMKVTPEKVLVIDAENGMALVQRRCRAMGLTEDGKRHVTWKITEGFDIEKDRDLLRAAIQAKRPGLLILDTWTSLWGGSESSVDGVKRCLNGLRALAQEFDVAIVLIHHTLKDGDGYRGSSAIAGTIEAVFLFTRDDDGAPEDRLLTCEKMRLDAEPKTRRLVVTPTGSYDADAV